MDLDGDGRADILSGSSPGDLYFFRRRPDGSFAAAEKLKDRHGNLMNVGYIATPFAVDWNGDGAIDLLVGNADGEVYLIPNEGSGKQLLFGQPRRLEADGKPIKVNGDAAPVAADWDGHGKLDLIVGAEDGSVVWFRNVGTATRPKLTGPRVLVPKSPVGGNNYDDGRGLREWGVRAKICVVDWNGDGRLDLLMGDRCGGFQGKPNQTPSEKAEEERARWILPDLRRRWANTFREYRSLQAAAAPGTAADKRARDAQATRLREQLARLRDEIAAGQDVEDRYQPQRQTHGFVWLFLRKPAATKLSKGTGP